MALQLQFWIKTQEAIEMLSDETIIFCIENKLFQGHKGAPFSVHEGDLTHAEMKSIRDVDGTLNTIWIKRRQRLEARFNRKEEEYSNRRVILLTRRNEILTSIEREQKLEIHSENSPLVREVKKIDARLEKISAAEEFSQVQLADDKKNELPEEIQAITPEQMATTCSCGKSSPPDHRNPKMWLRGHHLACAEYKTQRVKEAVAV